MMSGEYISILHWMRSVLDLKGNELLIYAIIYGYSQDGESEFCGGLKYLADWCGCTKQGVLKNLKHLVDTELIIKTENEKNGIKYCSYKVNTVKLSLIPLNSVESESIYNNIYNINKKESKNNNIKNNRGKSSNPKSLVKNKNLYQKCADEIKAKDFSEKLQDVLHDYLSVRLKMTDKPIYTTKQWIAILNRLDELAPNDEDTQIRIVKQSIERGWASFFSINGNASKRATRRVDKGVSCEQYTEEEKQMVKRYQQEVVKNGGRIKY